MAVWLYYTILAIGAVQGIVLGVLLWRSDTRRQSANRWLAAILFFIGYRLLAEILRGADLIGVDKVTYHFFLEYNWVYGPLLYFYVRAYLEPKAGFRRADGWLFAPVALQFVISNFIKTQNFFWDGTRESLSWLGYHGYIWWMHTPLMQVGAFLLVVWFARQARRELRRKQVALPWLERILGAFVLTGLVLPVVALADFFFFDYAFHPFYVFPLYITMALLLYWLGLAGFIHRDDPLPATPAPDQRAQWRELVTQLQARMEAEKLYLNPELTLKELAEQLNEKPYLLSQALNRELDKSFSDFVNEYRVRAFERLLQSEAHQPFTLLALAHEAGFNSKSSFNRAVRKFTGRSPSELRGEA